MYVESSSPLEAQIAMNCSSSTTWCNASLIRSTIHRGIFGGPARPAQADIETALSAIDSLMLGRFGRRARRWSERDASNVSWPDLAYGSAVARSGYGQVYAPTQKILQHCGSALVRNLYEMDGGGLL